MGAPSDRRYSETHEWHKVDGNMLTLGLTQFAVDQLTDLTFIEMKVAGTKIGAGDSIGEVESVKTTSDVYSAAAGEIVEVNGELADNPGLVNSDPYGAGWLVKVRMSDAGGLDGLMDAAAYEEMHG
jgi:glycine cleavage system H protein